MRLPLPAGSAAYDAVAAGWRRRDRRRLLSSPIGALDARWSGYRAGETALKVWLAALVNHAGRDALRRLRQLRLRTCWSGWIGADGDGLRCVAVAITAKTGARACCTLAPGGQGLACRAGCCPGGDVRENP